ALALMVALCGRSFNINGTGMNLYILILAATGSGKEEAARGIHRILGLVRNQVPSITDCLGPAMFASGQALVRVLDKKPTFLSIIGEFGQLLRNLSSPRATAPD